jgi:hypothetical protein
MVSRNSSLFFTSSIKKTLDELINYLSFCLLQFFALSGFPCPSLMNPSDHFLRTINKDFDQDIEQGTGGEMITTAQAIDTLVNSYKSSAHLEKAMRQIAHIRESDTVCRE